MGGPKISMLSKLCQTEKPILYNITYMRNLKKRGKKRKIYIAEKEQIHRAGEKRSSRH